jgi:hypothetical protein
VIIKGTSRSGPAALAAHLGNAEKNERVQLLETRGTVADDLRGALTEMDAYALGTRCERPLYHAAISPGPPHRLSPEQRLEAINALEEKLGMVGHARVVVLHEKLGREHLHVVWSRIDLVQMRSVSDGHNFRKHEEVARDLERRFGHERVQGAHHERDGVDRPRRTPSRSELRQEERTGIRGKDVAAHVTAMFRAADGPEAFRAALEQDGYVLAKGDRRDFVIVDRAGGIHSLARRIDGINASGLREFMSPLSPENVPNIKDAQELQRARHAKHGAYLDAKSQAAYGHGDDYVSQSRAAQKDFKRRQQKLNKTGNRDAAWDRVEKGERERLRREQERQSQDEAARLTAPSQSRPDSPLDAIEMTDAMQRLLGQADERPRSAEPPDGRSIDPQREAPGGGRTRSR